ncbi:MAG: molecular chaperone GroEL [Patescibacteria group bacterium]|nr:molecular chaperone GroEL [Patescibacteria group bacterium]
MPKITVRGKEAREKVLQGVNELADIVKSTLGPNGRNVILETGNGPVITNDGVTVANATDFEDPHMQIGAQLIKEVAQKTNDIAGDGTTTATVLAQAIVAGWEKVEEKANVYDIRRGIDKAVAFVVEQLKKQARPVESHEDKVRVATISCLDPKTGELIASCFDEVGNDGVITVETGQVVGLTKEVVKGMRIDRGLVSPFFITDTQKMQAVMENVPVVLIEKKINTVEDFTPMLEAAMGGGNKQLVVIADDFSEEVIAMAVVNRLKNIFRAVLIKSPMFGDRRKDVMSDIAVLTGANVVTPELGIELKQVDQSYFGQIKKLIANKDNTTIIAGQNQEAIDAHISALRQRIEGETNDYTKDFLKSRLARLTSGVAVIKVGADTEVETNNRKLKIEDAINATRAAVEEGVIMGGGVPLYKIATENEFDAIGENEGEKIGAEIIDAACQMPLFQIAANAGKDVAEFANTVTEDVIDPVKVARTALEKAASIAGELLTTEAVVINIPDKQPALKGLYD